MILAYHPPRSCRHEIVPATTEQAGLGFGPVHAHKACTVTGHVWVSKDGDPAHQVRVAPENLIWPEPPPHINHKPASAAGSSKPPKPKKPRGPTPEALGRAAALQLLATLNIP